MKFLFCYYIITSLPRLMSSAPFQFRTSINSVSPNIFVCLVGDGEFGMGLLSGLYEWHDFVVRCVILHEFDDWLVV